MDIILASIHAFVKADDKNMGSDSTIIVMFLRI